jgi:hypothetical protein
MTGGTRRYDGVEKMEAAKPKAEQAEPAKKG